MKLGLPFSHPLLEGYVVLKTLLYFSLVHTHMFLSPHCSSVEVYFPLPYIYRVVGLFSHENKAFMGSHNMLPIPVITLIAFPCTCSSFNSSFMNTEEQNGIRHSTKNYIHAFLSVLSVPHSL